MINLHIAIEFQINTIKIYKDQGYFLVITINDEYVDHAKSKTMKTVAEMVVESTKDYPEVDLKFHHKKGVLNKKKKAKLNDLIAKTEIVDVKTIISYLLLL